MPRSKPRQITANQLIAYNLMRARKLRGLSQEQAAERLEPFLGTRWSKATVSAAERSYETDRVRQFTADDLLAFSRAFDLQMAWFFFPPPTSIDVLRVSSGGSNVSRISDVMDSLFGRSRGDHVELTDRINEQPPGALWSDIHRRIGRRLALTTAAIEKKATAHLRALPSEMRDGADAIDELLHAAFSVDVVTGKTILDKEREK